MNKLSILGLIVFAIGVVLIIIGSILTFGVFPGIIHYQVAKNVRLVEGSEAYERWKGTMALKFKVHIFNVTNPERIMNGELPEVEEIGPYVYDLYRNKENISYLKYEDAYEYWQNFYFEFNAEESANCTEDDEIVVLNVAQQVVLQNAENMESYEQIMIEWNLEYVFPDTIGSLFHTTTVGKFLFSGYKFCEGVQNVVKAVCNMIKEENQDVETITENIDDGSLGFAFFKHKQNKKDGPYVVNAGINDLNQLGEIKRWKNTTVLDFWGTENETCNKVRGGDSSIYPPFSDEHTVHEVFNTDVCRILTLHYKTNTTYKDVVGLVSTLGVENLSNKDERTCFCVKGVRDLNGAKDCLPEGFGDLSPCTGTTIIMSLPHFLGANKTYATTVKGLKPNPKLHKTYVLIEPKTGSPLQGAMRMQFNMILRNMTHFTITHNLTSSVLPILWIEEEVAITDDLVKKINYLLVTYFDKIFELDVVVYLLIYIGVLLLMIGGSIFIMNYF